jgi:hypothetical protein
MKFNVKSISLSAFLLIPCATGARAHWSSCAYFYLDRPVNDLPKLDAAEKRTAVL